jgi:hypothetical protein
MGWFTDVLSIVKSSSSSESGRSFSFDYDEYNRQEVNSSQYFEGHRRGHHHDHGDWDKH